MKAEVEMSGYKVKIESVHVWAMCPNEHWHPIVRLSDEDPGEIALHSAILEKLKHDHDVRPVSLTPFLTAVGRNPEGGPGGDMGVSDE